MTQTHTKKKSTKLSKKEIITALTEEGPMYTMNKFLVSCESDDGGFHVVMRAERNLDDTSGFHRMPDVRHMGWRVICVPAPRGYLDVFYNADGSKHKTKDTDDLWFQNEER